MSSRQYKDPNEWRDVRDLFKTKICTLFSRGHCPRDRCNFAHGEGELRKLGPAPNDRYQGGRHGDRRRSPSFRRRSSDYSPRKGRRSYSPPPRRRTKSPSELQQDDGPNKRRKRDDDEPLDDLSEGIGPDVLESVKKDNEANGVDSEEIRKERVKEKLKDKEKEEAESKEGVGKEDPIREELLMKLKTLKDKVFMLESHKIVFEGMVEKREKKNMELRERMAEIEAQLEEAEEKSRRATSRLKRVMKAHIKVSKTQEELRKWQSKLNKLAEEALHEHDDHQVGGVERDRQGTDGFVSEDPAGSDGEGDARRVSNRNLHINLNRLPGTYSPVRRQEHDKEFAGLSPEPKRNVEKGKSESVRDRGEVRRSLEHVKMGDEYQFDDVEMSPKRYEDARENERTRGEGRREKDRVREGLNDKEQMLLRERRDAVKEALAVAKASMEKQQASQGRHRDEDSQG